MTLTIELSEADEALLQKAAERAKLTGEDLVRRAVQSVNDWKRRMRPMATDEQDFRQGLAELREMAKGVPNLPDSALHRASFYED